MNYTNQNQHQNLYENIYPNKQITNEQMRSIENNYNTKEEEIKVKVSLNFQLTHYRKVYSILCFRLLCIFLFTLIVMLSPSLQKFLLNHLGLLSFMTFLIIFFLILILFTNLTVGGVPGRFLLIFSLTESYIVGFISSYTNPKVVFMAAFAIFAMVNTLALYSINTTSEITIYKEILCIFLMAIILFFIFSNFTNYSFLNIILLILCVMLACFYIIWEIKFFSSSRDDYVIGGFMIYIDLFFLYTKIHDFFHDFLC